MGVFDFVQDAGAAVGIGKSTKEEATAKARKKADADAAAARKAMNAQKREAAKQSKARAAARKKLDAAKTRQTAAAEREASMEADKAEKLTKYVSGLGLKARGLSIGFDDGVATIKGAVADRATKEKMVLAVGNVEGVKQVKESIRVVPAKRAAAAPANATARKAAATRRRQKAAAQTMHTVKSGDTLSKLAKKYLGDANRYPEIFKANQPMLTDPDMIQVGQVLRIPRA